MTAGPHAQVSTAQREVVDGLTAMKTPKGAAKARKPKRVRKLTRPARAVGTVGTVDTMVGVPSCLRQPGCVRACKHPGARPLGLAILPFFPLKSRTLGCKLPTDGPPG